MTDQEKLAVIAGRLQEVRKTLLTVYLPEPDPRNLIQLTLDETLSWIEALIEFSQGRLGAQELEQRWH